MIARSSPGSAVNFASGSYSVGAPNSQVIIQPHAEANNLSSADAFTLHVDVMLSSASGGIQYLMAKESSALAFSGLFFWVQNSRVTFYERETAARWSGYDTAQIYPYGTRTRLTVTHPGNNTARIWLNGMEYAVTRTNNGAALGAITNTDPLRLGASIFNVNSVPARFVGQYHDAQIYRRVLSDAEIATLHQYPGIIVATPAVYLALNETSGNVARDFSSTRNHATLSGFASTALGAGNAWVDSSTLAPFLA